VVYLYAFYSAWIFSPLVKLDFIIFDFYDKVKRKYWTLQGEEPPLEQDSHLPGPL
jgi:hypothetical protein